MEFNTIQDFTNYEISRKGDVRNIITKKILNSHSGFGEYRKVYLFHDSKKKSLPVHRLVAKTYIENPDNKKIVIHINSVRDDNRVENLKWVTNKERCELSPRENFRGSSMKIKQLDNNNNLIREFSSISSTSNELSISYLDINLLCKGYAIGDFKLEYSERNIEGEEWKEYEDIMISNMGRSKHKNGRIGSALRVKINGKQKLIYRIVMMLFNYRDEHKTLVIHHIDGNIYNNKLDNLEWGDRFSKKRKEMD